MNRWNILQLVVALVQLGAAVEALCHRNYKQAALFFCYTICAVIVAKI